MKFAHSTYRLAYLAALCGGMLSTAASGPHAVQSTAPERTVDRNAPPSSYLEAWRRSESIIEEPALPIAQRASALNDYCGGGNALAFVPPRAMTIARAILAQGPDPLRREAMLCFAAAGSENDLDSLIPYLADPQSGPRALYAIDEITDRARRPIRGPIVTALLHRLELPGNLPVHMIAQALGQTRNPSVGPALLRRLNQDLARHPDADMFWTVRALRQIGYAPSVPVLLQVATRRPQGDPGLESPPWDSPDRYMALRAIGEMGGSREFFALLQFGEDPQVPAEARAQALQALTLYYHRSVPLVSAVQSVVDAHRSRLMADRAALARRPALSQQGPHGK